MHFWNNLYCGEFFKTNAELINKNMFNSNITIPEINPAMIKTLNKKQKSGFFQILNIFTNQITSLVNFVSSFIIQPQSQTQNIKNSQNINKQSTQITQITQINKKFNKILSKSNFNEIFKTTVFKDFPIPIIQIKQNKNNKNNSNVFLDDVDGLIVNSLINVSTSV